jgi:hypothetical protein
MAVTGRLWVTIGLSLAAPLVVAWINATKLRFRFEPIYPTDVHFANEPEFLLTMTDKRELGSLLALIATVAALCLLGRRLTHRGFPSPLKAVPVGDRNRWIAMRIGATVVAIAILIEAASFSGRGNHLRALYEGAGANWQGWSQIRNYTTNGFVAGFLYNVDNPIMSRPPGYGRATMEKISALYAKRARILNEDRTVGALDDVNVVLVLSESFTDPTRVTPVSFAEDPLPFVRELMGNTTGGSALAQNYGGGTANMEFSALTGQALALFTPQTSIPYQQVIPGFDTYPSAARLMSSTGHRTVAIHPYDPDMYMRDDVYPRLGFDSFISGADFESQSGNRFIKDSDAFDATLRQINRTDDPLFINLVTIQNHYPYDGAYVDPIDVSGASNRTEESELGNYARGLQVTDAAVQDFLAQISRSNEKTVVLFYGDHHPAVWSAATRTQVPERVFREMPMFVWSNLEENSKPQSLPTVSAYHFMNLVFEEAGAAIRDSGGRTGHDDRPQQRADQSRQPFEAGQTALA